MIPTHKTHVEHGGGNHMGEGQQSHPAPRSASRARICLLFALAAAVFGSCLPGTASAAETLTPVSQAPVDAAGANNGNASYVACPALTQCTAVDGSGHAVTFNPQSPGSPQPVLIDPAQSEPAGAPETGTFLSGIACPSQTECVAIDDFAGEITFNPQSPGSAVRARVDGIDFEQDYLELKGVACPSITQCTVVDEQGNEVTFNPQSPGTPTPTTIDGVAIIDSIACPALTECTALDYNGNELTFNPESPGTPAATSLAGEGVLTNLACPSTTECVTIENTNGDEVLFNPAAPASVTRAPVIGSGEGYTVSIACPSTTECVGTNYTSADVSVFNPTAPVLTPIIPIPGPVDTNLLDVPACPSINQCTGVYKSYETTFDLVSGTPPTCTLKAQSTKVLLAKPKKKGGKPKAAVGTLSLTAKCDQAATVKLTAVLTELVGKKPKHGKQKTRKFTIGPVRASLPAGVATTLSLKLPPGALSALKSKAKESVSFTLAATDSSGTKKATTAISRLVGTS
jgi:hypothetical protein